MPFYDFKCKSGHISERRTPPSARFRACMVCGNRAERQFPVSGFSALNTTHVGGMANFKHGLGVAPATVGDADKLMAEQGVRPAEDYRYTKRTPEDNRKEITEKELEEVIRDHNSLGTI
jgi:hypothetical protein